MKILYFDVETTGLDPKNDHIFQLSGLIDVDGEVKEEFNIFMQPPKGTAVSKEALRVTGKTIEDLRSYQPTTDGFNEFINILNKYVDPNGPYNAQEMFYPCAYNGNFDLQFLSELFIKQSNEQFYKYQNWQLIDPLVVFRMLSFCGLVQLPNHKLSTVSSHFGISIDAHDALSDVRATRDLAQVLKTGLKFDMWGNQS